ncbi:MAG: Gfo/Idh/MocA family oxidoreductase [Clostridia bacterium]|nr:Gfo/Idh/MocA family oxidoreductase [Clostridia bacterium]
MKKIKIGQIGIGHNHGAAKAADCKRLCELFEFVGVVAPDADEKYFGRKTAEVYRDVPFMTEEELFAIPDLEAVLIETSVPHLVPTAQRAIDRGLHIHLDKPAGEDIAEFEKLLMDAKAKKLAVQMGYMYRYNPGVLYALEQIEAGKLGDIHTIDAHMSTEHKADFRKFLSQFKGGSMYIFGCHLIDLIVKIKGKPNKVVPFLTHSGQDGLDFPDNCCAALVYDDGTCFIRTSSVEVNGWGRRQFVVCGTKGTIEIKPIENPMHVTEAYSTNTKSWSDVHTEVFPPAQEHRYSNMLTDFAKMIRGEGENPYTYEHDLYVHKATLAACGFDIEL